jgi:hypothetical protein
MTSGGSVLGFTAASVRQWEQGRRYPHGPARVLLTIIEREPGAVRRALARDQRLERVMRAASGALLVLAV